MTEHSLKPGVVHEVDGIEEEDNHLPNWWLATLFLAMVFSFFYWEYYHVLKAGQTPMEEYTVEARAAEARLASVGASALDDGALIAASMNAADTAAGAEVFTVNCLACHGAQAEGKIGPNLTDNFWIHGGRPAQIHQTVSNGFPLKGMPAWGAVLGSTKVRQVVAYLLTLRNKNVPGKAAEGTEMSAAELDALSSAAPKP